MTATRMREMRVWLPAAAVVMLAIGLSGCGVKGGLEPPPGAQVEGQRGELPAGRAPKKVNDRPFILDGLL